MHFSNTAIGQLAPVLAQHVRTETEKGLTSQLRRYARESGWPETTIPHLSVRYAEGSGFMVHVHPTGEQVVNDLEYGNQDRPPLGTLRQFQNRISTFADGHAFAAVMGEFGVEV